MENEDIIALLALGVSILGSIVNGLYTLDTRKKQEALEKEKIRADENLVGILVVNKNSMINNIEEVKLLVYLQYYDIQVA